MLVLQIPLMDKVPNLRVVLEHITTKDAVSCGWCAAALLVKPCRPVLPTSAPRLSRPPSPAVRAAPSLRSLPPTPTTPG
jgi:hypothetical protein